MGIMTLLPSMIVMINLVPLTSSSKWNILFANAFGGGSHQTVSVYLANLLSSHGHNVTYISTNIPRSLSSNVTKLDLPQATKTANDLLGKEARRNIFGETISWTEGLDFFLEMANFCENFFNEPNVQNLMMGSTVHFDLLVTFSVFDGCALSLGHFLCINNSVLHAPAPQVTPLNRIYLGIPIPASTYKVEVIKTADSRDIRSSVFSRAVQLASNIVCGFIQDLLWKYSVESVAYKHDHAGTYPGYKALYKNTRMIFLNTHPHPFIDQTVSWGPGVVSLGGSLCKPPNNETSISQDLRDFIETAPGYDGFIMMSFGSLVKRLPDSEVAHWLEAFSHFPTYKVVWRLAADHFTEINPLPNNIKVFDWLPQTWLLHHPNNKLFITHGGQASKMEAFCAGNVPLLFSPKFADQFSNAKYLTDMGLAEQVIVRPGEAKVDEIVSKMRLAMQEKYASRMKQVSDEVQGTKLTDGQVLGYLRLAVSGHSLLPGYQPWWQLFYLDIVLVPAVVILLIKERCSGWGGLFGLMLAMFLFADECT